MRFVFGLLFWAGVAALMSNRRDAAPPVKACAVLPAITTVEEVHGKRAAELDAKRIQDALNRCEPGRAVVLKNEGKRNAFEAAPLILPRGVTLFIDRGVTLFASRRRGDYDTGSGGCGGSPSGNVPSCKPFIFSYQAAYSAVSGGGVIDGQGGSQLEGSDLSWWDLLRRARDHGKRLDVPDLVSDYESQGFRIAGVTLRNAAGVHASLYKTTDAEISDVKIDSPENSVGSAGLLLSNVIHSTVGGLWTHVPGDAISLKASILGASSQLDVRNVHVFGGNGISIGDEVYGDIHAVSFGTVSVEGAPSAFNFNLKGTKGGEARQIQARDVCVGVKTELLRVQEPDGFGVALPAGRDLVVQANASASGHCEILPFSAAPEYSALVGVTTVPVSGKDTSLVVAQDGSGAFSSLQKAVDALPASGGTILVKPGTYREVVTIRKPHVHLRGEASDASQTIVVYNNAGPTHGGTFNSATVFVEADDVTLDHLTIANDAGPKAGQAVALAVIGDRPFFRNLRILGAQDTLFAASRFCYGDYGPCVPARQYFADSYIEGGVDFIFGDSKAVFEHCELHGLPTGNVMFTAQSKHTPEQESGYVFKDCRLTGEPRLGGVISLGRAWRPYATVVYLNARIDAPVIPAGWTDWLRFGKSTLPTAYFAEYDSTGPGSSPATREPYSHQLSAPEAEKWSAPRFLAGSDGWEPVGH